MIFFTRKRWLSLGLIFTALAALNGLTAEPAKTGQYSTPPGITLVEASSASNGIIRVHWVGLGDETGHTLFTFDRDGETGTPQCEGECAQDFPPLVAPPNATEYGNWSIVVRRDGSRQWAYQGKPLYRDGRETRFNEVVDNILTKMLTSPYLGDNRECEFCYYNGLNRDLTLPEGWQIAKYQPTTGLRMPSVVKLREIPAVSAEGFVDGLEKTLYIPAGDTIQTHPDCGQGCTFEFVPLLAAELANPVGEFSLVQRKDGTRQWALRGQPLFTYSGDLVPGDIHGLAGNADKPLWQVAVFQQHFLPSVATVREDPVVGNILARADGMPLYSMYAVSELNVFQQRAYDDAPYEEGKQLQNKGCDAECLKEWRPLEASEQDKASGFWEIVKRPDGTRQWAYKGFAQFTNINDKPSAPATRDHSIVQVVGDDGRYSVAEANPGRRSPGNASAMFGRGFDWRVSDIKPR